VLNIVGLAKAAASLWPLLALVVLASYQPGLQKAAR
jgi:hypothetical protein